MKLTTIGIDLAKNVLQVHGADGNGKAILKKQLKRAQVLPFFADLTPCRIGMQACGSARHWARELQALGHIVQLIPPQYVKPFVKRNKNDVADAEADLRSDEPAKHASGADQEYRAAGDPECASGSAKRGRRRPTRSGDCWPSAASRFSKVGRGFARRT